MGVDISDIVQKETIELEHLKSRKIAVDAYNTLYQFLSIIRQPDGTPLMNSQGKITSHLTGLLYRTGRLIEHEIKPCFVFDGVPPEQKHETILERQKTRTKAKADWEKALEEGRTKDASKYAQRSSKLTQEMVDQSKELLEALGIPYVEAPAEGEAQAALMASKGDVWAAASQDFDALLFGTPILIRNMTITGKRKLPKKNVYITLKPELIRFDKVLNELQLSREQLVDLSLLIGTDYNKGIKGVGPKTALEEIRKGKKPEEVYKEKNEELPELDVLRKLFLEPETTTDYSLQWKKPDKDKVIDLMCGKYDFSEERVEKAVDKMTEQLDTSGTQSRLDQYF